MIEVLNQMMEYRIFSNSWASMYGEVQGITYSNYFDGIIGGTEEHSMVMAKDSTKILIIAGGSYTSNTGETARMDLYVKLILSSCK